MAGKHDICSEVHESGLMIYKLCVYIVYIELSAYAPCGAKDCLLKARLDGSVLVESMYEEEGF